MAFDLAAITANAAAVAMEIAGTAKTSAVLHLAKTQTYDWATDSNTSSAGSEVTTSGIFYRASQKQRELTGNEAMFLIEGVKAPLIDEGDTAVIDGKTWQIHDVESVPGKAVIILGLRK